MQRRYLVSLLASPLLAYVERPPAPEFRGKTMAGEAFSRESLKGKPVLIQFWATWCGYCKRDEAAVERIIKESPELTVLAVNVGESKDKIRSYLKTSPRTAMIVANEDTNLPALYNPGSFPTYVLIDGRGGIAGMQKGSGGYEALRDLLKRL